MKVTPLKKKFGTYAPGDVFELKDKVAKILIKVGKLARAEDIPAGEPALDEPEVQQPAPAPEPEVESAPDSEVQADQVDADSGEPADDESTPETPAPEPEVQQKVLTSAEPATPAVTKRQYNRRDMTAEGSKSAPAKKATKKAATKRANAKG